MKILCTTLVLAFVPTAFAWSQGQTAQSPAPGGTSSLSAIGPFVRLQPNWPGVAQTGNMNITGGAAASQFVANSATSHGIVGTGADDGVLGVTLNPYAAGVEGVSYASYGYATYGRGYYGVGGQGTYGVVSLGTAYVAGDLVVTGSKTGYVVDLIRNGDSVPLAPGELVEIVGSEPAVLGDIPVAIVRRASAANARAVLGPISNALALGPELTAPEHAAQVEGEAPRFSAAQSAAAPGVLRVEGAILPGGYGNVVTLGAFRALKVDARFGAIRAGDLLVASSEPGFAMSDPDPRTGTVVGKALASWSSGQGEIPVMVGMR